jgi:hypothetical protein
MQDDRHPTVAACPRAIGLLQPNARPLASTADVAALLAPYGLMRPPLARRLAGSGRGPIDPRMAPAPRPFDPPLMTWEQELARVGAMLGW